MKLLNDADTTKEPDTLPLIKFPLASWVAVMVAVPTPMIVTTPSDVTLATPAPDASILYVNAPLLSLVGVVKLNDVSPKFLAEIVNVPIVGAIGETTNVAEILPDV